jgi:glycosyltransferase involved in cell wall biosynthesis
MKRVLIVIKGLGRGGAEQLLVNAAPYWDRTRFDYEVAFLLPWKDALVEDLTDKGVPVHCLDGARGPGWVRRLRALVSEHDIDIVHFHSPVPASLGRLAFGRSGPGIVTTEHNVWARYHRMTYWINALTFSRNDHVFAVSDEVRRSVDYPVVLRGRRMPPVETLHHGPDAAEVARWGSADGVRDEFGIPDDAPLVGMVANFKTHKGHVHLLDAAAHVTRRLPDARFMLVGQGPLEPEIRARAEEMGLTDNFVFAGFRSDVPRILRSLDVFTLSSLHEGLSIAMLEAMCLGVPPVVTSVGGQPEVVEDGRNGFLVPPGDPDALSDRLLDLLENPSLRAELAQSALNRAADFDIRHAVERMEQVYLEILR